MHCLNGNTNQTTPPIILSLSLDSLLPVDTITPNHHNDLPVFKLSRNFLLEQGPPKIVQPPTAPIPPAVDPWRFQSIDKIIARSEWLPSVQKIASNTHTGFPSDQYL